MKKLLALLAGISLLSFSIVYAEAPQGGGPAEQKATQETTMNKEASKEAGKEAKTEAKQEAKQAT